MLPDFLPVWQTILALFESALSEAILRQSSCDDDNLSYNPRKFIQLWHNVTENLPPDCEITRDIIERFNLTAKSVAPPEVKEPVQAEQQAEQPVSSQTLSESSGNIPDHKQLREMLNNYFSVADIQTLCFDFDIDYEGFSDKKPAISTERTAFFKRNNRLGDLWMVIQKQRQFLVEPEQA